MSYIDNKEKLLKIINKIPSSETAKIAIVRPTKHFEIATKDNPYMVKTLKKQKKYVQSKLEKFNRIMSDEDLRKKRLEINQEFKQSISMQAKKEQRNLLAKLKEHGVEVREILEDKNYLENSGPTYFTDQIFATDTGQYYDHEGQLTFIPAYFKNKQRQGEERLAVQQAKNLGAKVKPLFSRNEKPLIFEGGDVRQMPGKKLFFIGQGYRSESKTSQILADITSYYVLPIKLLQEQFYHLDCCFLPLPNDSAVVYEGEYQLDALGQKILNKNGWPELIPGTETMAEESRALIRTLYSASKLILIDKNEALAFATNAALLQSSKDKRFKLFVNGEYNDNIENEKTAISTNQISFTRQHLDAMKKATEYKMDIIEVPYRTIHSSGGSVRCTIQEVPCTHKGIFPHKINKHHFSEVIDKLEKSKKNLFFRARTCEQIEFVEPAKDVRKL